MEASIKRRIGSEFHILPIERLHLRASNFSYRSAARNRYLDVHFMVAGCHEDRCASLARDLEEGLVLFFDDGRLSIVESHDGITGPNDERRFDCSRRSKDSSGSRWQREIRFGWPAVPGHDEREALTRSRS